MTDRLDKVIENLPDVWFDWYARLIPGCFGVGLYSYLSSGIPAALTGVEVVLFLLLGYGLGHVLQPAASFVVKPAEDRYGNEPRYAEAKKNPGVKASSLNKVSKAHAEANSMLGFGFALLVNMIWFWNCPRLNKWVAFVSLIYFLLAAWQRISARNRKIKDLGPS